MSGDMLFDLSEVDFLGVRALDLFRQVDRRLTLEGHHLIVQRTSAAVDSTCRAVGWPAFPQRSSEVTPTAAGAGRLQAREAAVLRCRRLRRSGRARPKM